MKRAFTLVELLVAMGLVGALASILFGVVARSREGASRASCAGRMKHLATAVTLYASDHGGQFPRSQHSAGANGELPWGRSLGPYLGETAAGTPAPGSVFECPSHRRRTGWSYGLNVHFELGPEDDYAGSPQTWRTFSSVPRPADTILFGEVSGSVDHVMAHFWPQGSPPEVDAQRHGTEANYAHVDGCVVAAAFTNTYDPGRDVDQWNPRR